MLIIENPSHTLFAEQSELLISEREKDALDFIGIVFKSPVGSPVGTTVLLDAVLPCVPAEHCLRPALELLHARSSC